MGREAAKPQRVPMLGALKRRKKVTGVSKRGTITEQREEMKVVKRRGRWIEEKRKVGVGVGGF